MDGAYHPRQNDGMQKHPTDHERAAQDETHGGHDASEERSRPQPPGMAHMAIRHVLHEPTGAGHGRTHLEGTCSYYGHGEHLNKHSKDGSTFDPSAMTAACYSVPMHSWVRVTNKANGHSVVVQVTDHGPNKRLGRLIDVTYAAAGKLKMVEAGLAHVSVEIISGAQDT